MCGIVGFLNHHSQEDKARALLETMAARLETRGPDAHGVWYTRQAGLGFGHRRLSILDLSETGQQPMHSASGRFTIIYNGEVYNAPDLSKTLEQQGVRFRGHSDTEVILAAIEVWGLDAALARFIGMFAFALWDRDEGRLSLVRDRLGIKPLYYGFVDDVLLFASELEAFRPFPGFGSRVDRNALATYLRLGYVPAPYSIYEGFSKLMPGQILDVCVREGGLGALSLRTYWDLREVVSKAVEEPFTGSDSEAIGALETLLRDAVGRRMLSDVPLGAFLSGGIDSSTVVALMQSQSARPVDTFSIGFLEDEFNEAPFARKVAEHLGTHHTELYVGADEALRCIPELPRFFDEPFADASQIPTYLVSRLARQHVTVSLSGDGGDELFAGYTRYTMVQRLWSIFRRTSMRSRAAMAAIIARTPDAVFDLPFFSLKPLVARYGYSGALSDKMAKLAPVLVARDVDDLYRLVNSTFPAPSAIVTGGIEYEKLHVDRLPPPQVSDPVCRMMFQDLGLYLPDDILVKVDRASMAVSLEARVPILDHRVVELAWRLPGRFRVRNGQNKWILRQVLARYVPLALFERPKMGFGVPLESWLRGPLRDWSEALLDARRLSQEGFFVPSEIRTLWAQHLSGRRRWHARLWTVLMFQAWLENQLCCEGGGDP